MGNKQVQEVGNNSSAVQVHGDYKVGLCYRDVKELCVDLIQANFPILQEQARVQSMQYVEEFGKKFFETLKDENPEFTQTRLKDPDVQASINSSIIHVARMTNKSHQDILCELLTEKIKEQEDEKNIIFNDAIEVMTKISKNQILFITFIYMIREIYPLRIAGDLVEMHPDFNIHYDYFENEILEILGENIYKVDTFILGHKGLIRSEALVNYSTPTTEVLTKRTNRSIPNYRGDEKIGDTDPICQIFPKFTKIIKDFGFESIKSFDSCPITNISAEIAKAFLKNKKALTHIN